MLRVKDSVLFPLVLAAGNPVPIQVARAQVKDCVLSPLVFIAGYPVIILGAIIKLYWKTSGRHHHLRVILLDIQQINLYWKTSGRHHHLRGILE